MIPRSGFGGSTDTDTTSGDSGGSDGGSTDTSDDGLDYLDGSTDSAWSTTPEDREDDTTGVDTDDSYDAGDTTGLQGGGDADPTLDRNTADGSDDATAPADSTTGLTNDGTTVVDRNDPADVTEEEAEQNDGETVDGVDYTGLPEDPEQDVADQVEDASENNPYVDDVSDEEWEETQDDNNPWSDDVDNVVETTEETVDNVVETTEDAAENTAENVEDAIDNALDQAADQMPDVPGANVPWKLVLGGAGVLGLMFLARPYAGLANSAT